MLLISHRGNTIGPNKKEENKPDYVRRSLDRGFDVEVDVWKIGGQYYLGHDEPSYPIGWSFLEDERLWCHSKNVEALAGMIELGIHCFFHIKDDVTLTSRGFLWTYPGKTLTDMSIAVMPESTPAGPQWIKARNMAGICSDFVEIL